jgi:hypothetical protein
VSFLYSPPGTITGPFTGAAYVLNGTVTVPGGNEFFLPAANNPSIAVAGVVVFGLTATLALVTNTGGIEHQQTGAAAGGQVLLAGGPSGVTTNRVRYTSNAAGNNQFAIRDDTNAVDRLTISSGGAIVITAPTAGVALTVNGFAGSNSLIVNQPAASTAYGAAVFGSATAGQSLGVAIVAGTTAADAAIIVLNQAQTHTLFNVFGDGHFTLGNNTVSNTISSTAAGNVTIAAPSAGVALTVAGSITLAGGQLLATSAALTNNAAANAGTLTNAPAIGNPTKWIPINDNGTVRNIPAW